MKVYGPYTLKSGRKIVVIKHPDGTKQTISYPKYLVEQLIGRKLRPDETVDHKDRDFTNDDPSNLQILKRGKHSREDAWRLKPVTFRCPLCGRFFRRSGKRLVRIYERKKLGKAGPFCSPRCQGKYAVGIREGLMFRMIETYEEFLERHPKEYYQRDKEK